MKSLTVTVKIFTLLSLLFFYNHVSPAQTRPQLKPDEAGSPYTLPAGTVIRVKMDNGITSRSANVNDTFTTTVAVPVFVRSVEVIPAGTVIEGRVVKVEHAKRGNGAGFIGIAFETMRLPGGAVRKIAGELGADEEDGPGDADSTDAGDGDNAAETVGIIAGGAGAGALVGGLARGGSGAAIGGAIGAGAGALASFFRKGDEAVIKTNAQLAVILKQSVTLPAQDF